MADNTAFFDDYEDFEDYEDEFDGRPYMFEPEYTEEELLERRRRREREGERAQAEEAAAQQESLAAQPRTTGSWWCSCESCDKMPTEEECFCCKDWDVLHGRTEGVACVTLGEGFRSLLHLWVLEAFFHVPKVNWKKRPTPEGPNGSLSTK